MRLIRAGAGPAVTVAAAGRSRRLDMAARFAHPISAVLVAWLSHRAIQAWPAAGLLTLPPAWCFIGSRFRALGNMMHECSHRTFVQSARWNRRLGHFLGFFDFTDFVDYTAEHFTHHRRLGDAVADRDFAARRDIFEALGPLGARHVRYALALRHVPRYVRPILWSRRDKWPVAAARAAFHLSLVAAAHLVIGWPAFLLYYLVPYLTVYQVLRFLSDAADHAGIISSPDEFDRSRNHIDRRRWVNWLLFPRQDQYHLVHHLFPQVPAVDLARVHRLLLAVPAYAAREHGLVAQRTEGAG